MKEDSDDSGGEQITIIPLLKKLNCVVEKKGITVVNDLLKRKKWIGKNIEKICREIEKLKDHEQQEIEKSKKNRKGKLVENNDDGGEEEEVPAAEKSEDQEELEEKAEE